VSTNKTGVITRLKTSVRAQAAALRHRNPSRALRVMLVVGQDGTEGTVAFLASILRATGQKVGVATQQYVEIGNERAVGSDQADISGDAFRLQGLLAQMRRARCKYALLEVPPELPAHQFAGINPTMVIIRRCGDNYGDQISASARVAMLSNVLGRRPRFVVYNRDDPAAGELSHLQGQEGVISFGTHHKAESKIVGVELHPKGSAVRLLIDHQTQMSLATVMTGKQAIYSAAAAASAAYILHVPIDAIEEGVLAQPQLEGQLENIPLQRPYELVLDTSVTPGGLAESLETLKHFVKNRLIVLFGTPLGARPSQLPVYGEIIAQFADRVVITDGEYSSIQSPQQMREQLLQGVTAVGGEAKTDEVADRREAIEKVISTARRGDLIVLAGVTKRPYRQLGTERLPWSDRKIIEELFEP
jgi:UDP-N-acetylmuramoyl-L-alanyl-D-glutamate--2,6-diaminopimelate ligase